MRLASLWFALVFTTISFAAEPPVDVNNATQEVIETLPGIGPRLAQEIIAGRPYRTFSDLDKVKGIGPKKLDQLRGRVIVVPVRAHSTTPVPPSANSSPAKVNLNTASQAELEKLPGIGPKRAEAIIAARPFRKPEDLLKVPNIKRAQFEQIKAQVTAP